MVLLGVVRRSFKVFLYAATWAEWAEWVIKHNPQKSERT
jgi:hypothetical protein